MEILSVNSISKGFGEKKVLDDVSLSLQKGELISLLGVSGAGKTTLFNCISGILTADSGSILLNGNNITGKPGQVSYMLQKDMLLEYKKIIDNVSLPLLISGMSKKAARKEAQKHFEEFGIAGTENMYPGELSGGMRQRAMIARALAQDTPVILLDEPTAFLDLPNRYALASLLRRLAHDEGRCILFSTHDLDIALSLCDSVLLIDTPALHHLPAAEMAASGLIERLFAGAGLSFDPLCGRIRTDEP